MKEHWEEIFTTKAEDELSWFQPYPKTSIEFIEYFNLPLDANIIDVGGGDSYFVDALLKKGYRNIHILDISKTALNRAKLRLGPNAHFVHWIVSDILEYKPEIKFDFWHDRAAFHFLTSQDRIQKYISLAGRSIRDGGLLVLGTFSEEGPSKCSGLEIKQYNETSMSLSFEKEFERIRCINEDHVTPFNTIQRFLFCSFRKKEKT
jgi:SAM-dependent methyltransferase